jgi:DNA-directed RNA polymerase subunit RPC12/RpoP
MQKVENKPEKDGKVYMCDYCGKGNFVAQNKEVFEEGIACPDCGMVLLPEDCVEIGLLINGEMYYRRGDGHIHESEMSQMEKAMFHGMPHM